MGTGICCAICTEFAGNNVEGVSASALGRQRTRRTQVSHRQKRGKNCNTNIKKSELSFYRNFDRIRNLDSMRFSGLINHIKL
jgi:hypothetical protein